VDGVLIVNKPAGMTSHDVVAQVRRILNERSVGHLGTLDPSATGVLPLVIGRFTRLAAFYNDADKRYEGVIRFGVATDTYDAEGEPAGPRQAVNFSLEQLREAAGKFLGVIRQMPPPFSAKKISGVPAYKLARKKQPVELQPKEVEIKEFEILDFDGENARFKAWVSSGTYLRSLAHDLGKALGPGAHLGELSRTAVREFELKDAHSLEELAEAAGGAAINTTSDKKYYVNNAKRLENRGLQEILLHPRLILPEFPAVTATHEALAKIRHGAAVNLPYFDRGSVVMVRVFEGQRRLVALARQIAGTLFHPKVVLM
jgi:tRNA pseudouridine55 synthase